METLEKQYVADLHWLATLLTGCREIAAGITVQAIVRADEPNAFFASWMHGWSRRILIAKAMNAVRGDLAASGRRAGLMRTDTPALPRHSWELDRETSKSDLERALLSIEVFPRAAVLLLLFEGMAVNDAAILLDSSPDLVRKAQALGVAELTVNLATMQGWRPATKGSGMAIVGGQHA